MNNIQQQIAAIKSHIPLLEEKAQAISQEYHVSYDELLSEMVKYLNLVKIAKQPISPSHIVDLIWHEFILFTRYYAQFCKENYNQFIHHTPSKNENPNSFYKTLKLYILTYGEPHEKIWGHLATKEWENANCGSCHN